MPMTEAPLAALPIPAMLIGSDRVSSGSAGSTPHVYAATGRPTHEVPIAGAAEIDNAVAAAQEALPSWTALSAGARRDILMNVANLLHTHTEELALLATVDNGTPLMVTRPGPPTAAEYFAYNAGWCDKLNGDVVPVWPQSAHSYTIYESYGVVGIIIPWNGPVQAIGMTVAPALAAGNCVVVKPPEVAPYAALRIGELLLDAGVPAGVVNIIPGGAEAGEALVQNPRVAKIHFTGSAATARSIIDAAKQNLTPLGLELGGKSANVVFASANLDDAAAQISRAAVMVSGQGCIAGTRALIERSVYDDVIQRVAARAALVPMGDPLVETTVMGPVASKAACTRILGIIENASATGMGRVVTGGKRAGGDLADGWFIEPTAIADVDNASPLAQEEIFGPVVALMTFDDEDEAVEMANATEFGLAAYIQTRDVRQAHRVARALDAGIVFVNDMHGLPPGVPFGGVKNSGWGRLGGRAGIEEFAQIKSVYIPQ